MPHHPLADTKTYAAGLLQLGDRLTDRRKEILIALYHAPERCATASELVSLAGVRGGVVQVNKLFGGLGRAFCDTTGITIPGDQWWPVWADGFDGDDGFVWAMHEPVAEALESLGWVSSREQTLLPEESPSNHRYFEGSRVRIVVNAYERNRKARADCIACHGTSCCVCSFDFAAYFGSLGHGYIHVHHITLLSSIGEEYMVDAIDDLRPVCPNCHAMLHRTDPPMTIEALQGIIRESQNKELDTKAAIGRI